MRDSVIAEIERVLVNRCLAGDKAAQHELIFAYQQLLLRAMRSLACRRHWPPELAEEAAQEMWTSLLKRHWHQLLAYTPEDSLLTFLIRLARDQGRLIWLRQQRRSWEVLRPFRGHEAILAIPFEMQTDFEIEDLCSTLNASRMIFLKMKLLRPDRRHILGRSRAFRQTKHRVWLTARAYVSGG